MFGPTVALLLLTFALHADYQDGLDAYQRDDYLTAMREWRAVTDGPATAVVPTIYVEAHYAVAMLYWQGEGVAVDFRQARDWLLKAATNEPGPEEAVTEEWATTWGSAKLLFSLSETYERTRDPADAHQVPLRHAGAGACGRGGPGNGYAAGP